ncbi:MAG: proteasome subunit alpha [Actinomycetota bacterium]
MSMPYYVGPEQMMKDKAEFAQKGIARGRSLVATVAADGIVLVAENPSRSLHKISEIYDRIAFGGVGKYNEYDQLRVAGVRQADMKGLAYSREDVDARALANAYAQYVGGVFANEHMKPLEVELVVAELGDASRQTQLYHVAYEGTITDRHDFVVLGGEAGQIMDRIEAHYDASHDVGRALQVAVTALAGPDRSLEAHEIEVAVLSNRNGRRCFARVIGDELSSLLASA